MFFFFKLILILWIIGRKYRTRPGLIGCQSVTKAKRKKYNTALIAKIAEEIKNKKGQWFPSPPNSRIRDLFRSGSSALDSDGPRLSPTRGPASTSDVGAPGERERNRGPVFPLPPGVSRLPPPVIPAVAAMVIGDGPEEKKGEPALIDIWL
jgi:hypothetical protein